MQLLTVVFIFGLCVGSFLNVLIYRLPHSLPLSGRSFCPKCKKKISWFDNLPLVSYLGLRGRCRKCHSPISIQYPLVELITGILFLAVVYFFQKEQGYWDIKILGYWLIISALIVIFVSDLKYQIIPDQVVYPAILITLIYNFLLSSTWKESIRPPSRCLLACLPPSEVFWGYLLPGGAAGGFFYFLYLITRGRGMGLGDVKLAVLMGLFLGFPKIVVALYLAFLTGAFVGVILILAGKKRFGQHIPFGPFLTGATLVSLFGGEEILKWLTVRFF